MGLGKSGLSTAQILQQNGAIVWAWDDDQTNREKANIELTDLYQQDFAKIDFLVLSPGIPLTHPEPHPIVQRATSCNKEIICDVELLRRAKPNCILIGITGTNGKSTTTALTAHILSAGTTPVAVGGNLGTPVFDLPDLPDGGIYVLELSSYQLDLMPSMGLDIAALLNITPDHLDRHGGFAGYIKTKQKIFDNQTGKHTAILSIDDEQTMKIYEQLKTPAQKMAVSTTPHDYPGYDIDNGILREMNTDIMDLKTITQLPGTHNWQNMITAYAIARTVKMEPQKIIERIKSFPGLAHRQETIATVNKVLFVNDSKATNQQSAEKALSCYGNIYWIAGGQAKEQNLDDLKKHFPKIAHAYLIGQDGAMLADILTQNNVPCTISQTLQNAVQSAYDQARLDQLKNPVVLLSPACASWDQFKNFEHRGEQFKQLVMDIKTKAHKVS